jgi:hypothetical protein
MLEKYSEMKRLVIGTYNTRDKSQIITLNLKKKSTYCIFPFIENSRVCNAHSAMVTESNWAVV